MTMTLRPISDAIPGTGPPVDATNVPSVASGVRLRVILPLALAMVLLVGTFVTIFIFVTRHHEINDAARTAASVDVMFREQSAEGTQVMRSIMELLLQDRTLEAALRARDRQKLLELSAPILNEIKAKNRITHFYYILPDRTMLLRVQAPGKHGDKIERFVLQEAQRTGKPFWGNEQGPLGSFTLRVVYPWISNDEVIGYLEMGIEFEDIMQGIKNFLDVEVFVAINKSFFDQAKWEEAQAKRNGPVPWNEFPTVVVLSRTTPAIPAPIASYFGALGEQHSKRSFEIAWDQKVAQTIVLPFANLRGQELGELVVVRDITAGASQRRQALIGVAILGTVIGGGLILLFYILLGRVQCDVAQRTARLGEAQRVLTVEQFERQRAEGELTAQQERNELLEARSQMVEELAIAKEAAEAALQENEKVTQQLRLLQSELLAAARLAGMAENATNVLHNVGNALNSVNVSAALIVSGVRASKVQGLGRAVQLMNEHAVDLGAFLASDAKGKMLPGYLGQLANVLATEQQGLIEELGALTKSVDYIKEIIAAQQTHAGASSLVEPVQIHELVEDALRMNAGALASRHVIVEKDFATIPELPLDKGRVLQILSNLIRNAKQAMEPVTDREPRLTLSVAVVRDQMLRIGIADTGVGIALEN